MTPTTAFMSRTLNRLRSNIRSEEGPGESYLPGPGQRLVTRFRDRVAQGDGGHDAPSVRHEPLAWLELGSGVEDQGSPRYLGQASDLNAKLHRRVIRVVPGRDDDGD